MAKRNIEEVFQAIQPRGRRGVPAAAAIGVGVSGNNGDLSSSLSQAGQSILALQAAYQQQAALVAANTQAVLGNTSAHSGSSAAGVLGNVASGFSGGILGLLSPIISGIAGLFGGGPKAVTLPTYTPPAPVAISASSGAVPLGPAAPSASYTQSQAPTGLARNGDASATRTATSSTPAASQQITVNVNAMDSQSFMDRSSDIANAVREAMLNMHPINDVVSSL